LGRIGPACSSDGLGQLDPHVIPTISYGDPKAGPGTWIGSQTIDRDAGRMRAVLEFVSVHIGTLFEPDLDY
jgi:hypothetical protein